MANILEQIVAKKQEEIAAHRAGTPIIELRARIADLAPPLDLAEALVRAEPVGLIAEVKRASPSAGVIRSGFDPCAIAQTYAAHGAHAISVLTDEPFFQGHLDHLRAIRSCVDLPLLRKDFILDPYQILEARCFGADAVLLIAEILTQEKLVELLDEAREAGMGALVELYDAENVSRVVESGARLIGINNRQLRTFETQLDHTIRLAPGIPRDRILVSESGIRTGTDVRRLRQAGVRAILVGESLMRAGDIPGKLREFLAANDPPQAPPPILA